MNKILQSLKLKPFLAVGIIASLILVSAIGVSAATGTLKDQIANIAGGKLAELIYGEMQDELNGFESLGSAASPTTGSEALKTTVQKATLSSLDFYSSSTAASFLNSDGETRYIESVTFYLDALPTLSDAANLRYQAGTSSTAGGTTTKSIFEVTSLATSTFATSPVRTSTSTFTAVNKRIWRTGEYLRFVNTNSTSTLGADNSDITGFIKVIYDLIP